MVEIFVSYEGGLHCQSAHGPSGVSISTDAPVDNMGKGAAFSPTDLAATSLATCMLTTMGIVAQKLSLAVNLTGAKARVGKHMTTNGPRRIAKVEVLMDLPGVYSDSDRQTLEHAALNCPVYLSLHPDVEKVVTFCWES